MKSTTEIEARATNIFNGVADKLAADTETFLANRIASPSGLRSGKTIIEAVGLFEASTGSALDQILLEVGGIIEHRGRAWDRAIRAVRSALDVHLARGPDLLEPAFRMSGARGRAADAGLEMLSQAGGRLRAKLSEFGEGWSAPRAKMWHERHPLLYGAVSFFGGVVLTKLVDWLIG